MGTNQVGIKQGEEEREKMWAEELERTMNNRERRKEYIIKRLLAVVVSIQCYQYLPQ